MILIKMGGSVITDKSRPMRARPKAVEGITRALRRAGEPVIAVHGGGSYGHHWSVIYDMHTKESEYGAGGVAAVKNSMVELNRIVLDQMAKGKSSPYCFPPAAFMSGGRPIRKRIAEMAEIAGAGMVPVTYGDALWHGNKKTYILSGDRIMTILARALAPRLCIFALNEDGLYSDMKKKSLVRRVGYGQATPETPDGTAADVTGGMSRKVAEAKKITGMGIPVFLANGNRPERIARAIRGSGYVGTLFGGRGQ